MRSVSFTLGRAPLRIVRATPFAIAVASLSLSCAPLPELTENVCGNGVAEPRNADVREDCDGSSGFDGQPLASGQKCNPAGQANECRYSCALDPKTGEVPACPPGWGCNTERVCARGEGTFTRGADLRAGQRVLALRRADIDADGRDELVTASDRMAFIDAFDATGAPTSGATLGPSTLAPIVADVSGDGRSDVMLSEFGVTVLRGQAAGSMQLTPYTSLDVGALAGLTIMADALPTRDGVYFGDESIAWVDRPAGNGKFVSVLTLKVEPRARAAWPELLMKTRAADVRQVETVRPAPEYGCETLIYSARTTPDAPSSTEIAHFPLCRRAADGAWEFNGCRLDPFECPGNLKLPTELKRDAGLAGAELVRFDFFDGNGDGRPDILATYAGPDGKPRFGITFASPNPDWGHWSSKPLPEVAAAGDPTPVADGVIAALPDVDLGKVGAKDILRIADLTGDLSPDFVLSGGVVVTIPDGSGKRIEAVAGAERRWRGAEIVDVNRDGRPDVVAFRDGKQGLDVVLNGGNDAFARRHVQTAGYPFALDTGDFDGDGVADVLFAEAAGPVELAADAPRAVCSARAGLVGADAVSVLYGAVDRELDAPSQLQKFECIDQIAAGRDVLPNDFDGISDFFVQRRSRDASGALAIFIGSGSRALNSPLLFIEDQKTQIVTYLPVRIAVAAVPTSEDATAAGPQLVALTRRVHLTDESWVLGSFELFMARFGSDASLDIEPSNRRPLADVIAPHGVDLQSELDDKTIVVATAPLELPGGAGAESEVALLFARSAKDARRTFVATIHDLGSPSGAFLDFAAAAAPAVALNAGVQASGDEKRSRLDAPAPRVLPVVPKGSRYASHIVLLGETSAADGALRVVALAPSLEGDALKFTIDSSFGEGCALDHAIDFDLANLDDDPALELLILRYADAAEGDASTGIAEVRLCQLEEQNPDGGIVVPLIQTALSAEIGTVQTGRPNSQAIATGDFNGDGATDIAVAGAWGVQLMMQNLARGPR